MTTSPYANLTPDQINLTEQVLSDPDGRDSRDLLIEATASPADKAAVAEALGGPGAGDSFLTGTAAPNTPADDDRRTYQDETLGEGGVMRRDDWRAERGLDDDDQVERVSDTDDADGM